jgi:hypothetical protein
MNPAQVDRLSLALRVVNRENMLPGFIELIKRHKNATRGSEIYLMQTESSLVFSDLQSRLAAYMNPRDRLRYWLSDAVIDFMISTRPLVAMTDNRHQLRPSPRILPHFLWISLEAVAATRFHRVDTEILPQMMRAAATSNSDASIHKAMRDQLAAQQYQTSVEAPVFKLSRNAETMRLTYQITFEHPLPPLTEVSVPLLGPEPFASRCILIPQNNHSSHWWTIVILYDEIANEVVVAFYDSLRSHLSREDHVGFCEKTLMALVEMGVVTRRALASVQSYPRLTVPFQDDFITCGFQFANRAMDIDAEIRGWSSDKRMTLANFMTLNALTNEYKTQACTRAVDKWMDLIKTLETFFPNLPATVANKNDSDHEEDKMDEDESSADSDFKIL